MPTNIITLKLIKNKSEGVSDIRIVIAENFPCGTRWQPALNELALVAQKEGTCSLLWCASQYSHFPVDIFTEGFGDILLWCSVIQWKLFVSPTCKEEIYWAPTLLQLLVINPWGSNPMQDRQACRPSRGYTRGEDKILQFSLLLVVYFRWSHSTHRDTAIS